MTASVTRTLLLLAAVMPGILAYAAAIGLGLHRHGSPLAVSASATLLVFLPPLAVSMAVSKHRLATFAGATLGWALLGLLIMPVYFPGERREAVNSGLALFLGTAGKSHYAESISSNLPEEVVMAEPELEVAEEAPALVLPPARDILAHEIVLPYEGEGRNLSIPVVFQHGDTELELSMMLDTGATYTTLSTEVLERLGITLKSTDPVLTLHTANGERQANVVLVDKVWLGDLALEGVAIATCDACSSTATAGLLGLNVASGFNTTIDADRREVVFSRRVSFDRKLDIKPFLELEASFARYPGGRVEVTVDLSNEGDKDVLTAAAKVRCGERTWVVELGSVAAHDQLTSKRKLPRHDACESYRIELEQATW